MPFSYSSGRGNLPLIIDPGNEVPGGSVSTTTKSHFTPSSLSLLTQPSVGSTGAPINPAVQIQLLDGQGAPVTSGSYTIIVSLQANPGNATLSGTLTQPVVGGIATFDDLKLNKKGDGYTLYAELVENTSVNIQSASFDINQGIWGLEAYTWLDANDIDGDGIKESTGEAGVSGIDVNTWVDKASGLSYQNNFNYDVNGNTGSSTGGAPFQTLNGINFNDLVEFDNDLLGVDLDDFPTDDVSVYFILQTSSTREGWFMSLASGGGAQADEFVLIDPQGIRAEINNVFTGTNAVYNDGLPHIVRFSKNLSTGVLEFQKDFETTTTTSNAAFQTATDAEGVFVLGQDQNSLGGGFNFNKSLEGQLGDILIFDRLLTSAEDQQLKSYLSLKYGKAYDQDYLAGNTVSLWDRSRAPAYNNQVFGIGRATAYDFHQYQSKSTESGTILTLVSADSAAMADNTFMLIGHNASTVNDTTHSNSGSFISHHLERMWYVQERNDTDSGDGSGTGADVGLVDITFDMSGNSLPLTRPRILTDDNGTIDGNSTVLSYLPVINGRLVTFSDVSLSHQDYFTLSLNDGALGEANTVVITGQPQHTAKASNFSIGISLYDINNNLATASTDVTISLNTNPGGGTLSGTTDITVVSGTATVSDLSIDMDGSGYDLLVSVDSDPQINTTSNSFNVFTAVWGLEAYSWLDANDLDGDGQSEGTGEQGLSGSSVTAWVDKASRISYQDNFNYDVNGFIGTSTGGAPFQTLDAINFRSVVEFDNDHLGVDLDNFPTSDLSVYFMLKSTSARDGAVLSFASGSGMLANEFILIDPRNLRAYVNNQATSNAFALNDGMPHITRFTKQLSSGEVEFRKNFESFHSLTHTAFQTPTDAEGVLIIGQEQDDIGGNYDFNQSLEGQLGELVIFDRILTATEDQQLSSFLSLKYGKSYPSDYLAGNGVIIRDSTSSAGFSDHIHGVGKVSKYDFLQSQSKSEESGGMLSVMMVSEETLPEDAFMIFASNGAAAGDFSFTAIGTQLIGHLDRVWYLEERRSDQLESAGLGAATDLGNINLTFELPAGFTLPGEQIRLITDDDGIIGPGSVLESYTAVVSGDSISFNNINLAHGTYFGLTLDEIGVNHVNTTVTANRDTVVADGADSVQFMVQLAYVSGNLVDERIDDLTLVYSSQTVSPSGYSNLNGSYEFEARNAVAETVTVDISMGGISFPHNNPIVFVPGPADLSNANTTIVASPDTLEANAVFISTITIQLADAQGNLLQESGGVVTLQATGSASLSSVTDNADGTYAATISNSTVENVIVSGKLDGLDINDQEIVVFTAPLLPIANGVSAWFRADQGTSSSLDGAFITSWGDQSYFQTDAGLEAGNPTFHLNSSIDSSHANFNPVIRFDGDDALSFSSDNLPFGSSSRSFIAVARNKKETDLNEIETLLSYGSNGPGNYVGLGFNLFNVEMALGIFNGASYVGYNQAIDQPYFDIGAWILDGTNTSDVKNYKNGAYKAASVTPILFNTTQSGTAMARMGTDVLSFHFFDGEIAELLICEGSLSDVDQRKIESYLAIKYGKTLSSDNDADALAFEAGTLSEGDYLDSNGTAVWDASQRQSYHHNIGAIGRDDAFGLIQKQSASDAADAIVTIGLDDQLNPDGLESTNAVNDGTFSADRSFLFWGHDAAALNATNIAEYDPFQVEARLHREWRVSNTNISEPVVIRFDVSQLPGVGGPGSNDEAQFVLLLDSDGDFSQGATVVAQSFVTADDGYVNFTASLPDGTYFTLGSGESAALPVTLIGFSGIQTREGILLQWQTAKETDHSHFEVERSLNGVNFERIGLVNTARTTTTTKNYSFLDPRPPSGVSYYRLAIVGNTGLTEYSEVILVESEFTDDAPIAINAWLSSEEIVMLTTAYALHTPVHWQLYTTKGRLLKKGITRVDQQSSQALFSVSGLAEGWYLVGLFLESHGRKTIRIRVTDD